MKIVKKILAVLLGAAVVTVALTATVALSYCMVFAQGSAQKTTAVSSVDVAIMDRFDMRLNNRISEAMDGVLSIEKVYWLNDDDLVAPKPKEENFGKSTDPTELGWLIEESRDLMEGQELLFSTETKIPRGTEINYYLDETILAVTWKQPMDGSMYTICEVKIKHPSQLRRFLAGGEYGSEIQLQTSQMAQSVNAVLASAGDFYGYRREGIIVYDHVVRRVNASRVETCYIDEAGDLHLSYIGEYPTVEDAQAFVDENKVRFSLSFGPILVDNGQQVEIDPSYYLGQPPDPYPRAALCQVDKLHYLVVVVNKEPDLGCMGTTSMFTFQKNVASLGVQTAYAIDGGQTATVVMNGEVLNKLATGSQRYISDIFYFATALPEGE